MKPFIEVFLGIWLLTCCIIMGDYSPMRSARDRKGERDGDA